MQSKTTHLPSLFLALSLLALSLAGLAAPAAAQVRGDLNVHIDGKGHGEEKVYLYNSIRSFRQDHHGEKACLSAPGPQATFRQLPMGDYGVKLFRKDKTKVHRLPIAIVSDGQRQVGVPYSGGWEKNQFHMGRETQTIQIQIRKKK